MKNLIVCCDGTWNSATDLQDGVPIPTNVAKLFNALDRTDPARQRAYYHPGIGADEHGLAKLIAGATGAGLKRHVMGAYKWLAEQYVPKDKIFLIGFSRGAYTARALGGLLTRCGLLLGAGRDVSWKEIERVYVRSRAGKADAATRPGTGDGQGGRFHEFSTADPLHFIGVWDTVGALGVPKDLDVLGRIFGAPRFPDTSLSPAVLHAYHAVALDERRANFTPTLWTSEPQPHQSVEQRWFPGVHCDVGGGYKETGLSDGALRWMLLKALNAGARFDPQMLAQVGMTAAPQQNTLVPRDAQDVLHDSVRDFHDLMKTQPRPVPRIAPGTAGLPWKQTLSPEALARNANPPIRQSPYRKPLSLTQGSPVSVDVYAADYWSDTGIYLDAGKTYRLEASGEWKDWIFRRTPEGEGWSTALFLSGLRRNPSARWFALVGCLADHRNPTPSGDPPPMETVFEGRTRDVTPRQGGYLYCYVNEARLLLGPDDFFYRNNKGSLKLTVTWL